VALANEEAQDEPEDVEIDDGDNAVAEIYMSENDAIDHNIIFTPRVAAVGEAVAAFEAAVHVSVAATLAAKVQ